MKRDGEGKTTLSTEEARAGETSGHVRVILIAGIALAVIGLGFSYFAWFEPGRPIDTALPASSAQGVS